MGVPQPLNMVANEEMIINKIKKFLKVNFNIYLFSINLIFKFKNTFSDSLPYTSFLESVTVYICKTFGSSAV